MSENQTTENLYFIFKFETHVYYFRRVTCGRQFYHNSPKVPSAVGQSHSSHTWERARFHSLFLVSFTFEQVLCGEVMRHVPSPELLQLLHALLLSNWQKSEMQCWVEQLEMLTLHVRILTFQEVVQSTSSVSDCNPDLSGPSSWLSSSLRTRAVAARHAGSKGAACHSAATPASNEIRA